MLLSLETFSPVSSRLFLSRAPWRRRSMTVRWPSSLCPTEWWISSRSRGTSPCLSWPNSTRLSPTCWTTRTPKKAEEAPPFCRRWPHCHWLLLWYHFTDWHEASCADFALRNTFLCLLLRIKSWHNCCKPVRTRSCPFTSTSLCWTTSKRRSSVRQNAKMPGLSTRRR